MSGRGTGGRATRMPGHHRQLGGERDAGVGERALCVLGFGERHGEQEVAGRGVGHGITSVDGSCWASGDQNGSGSGRRPALGSGQRWWSDTGTWSAGSCGYMERSRSRSSRGERQSACKGRRENVPRGRLDRRIRAVENCTAWRLSWG